MRESVRSRRFSSILAGAVLLGAQLLAPGGLTAQPAPHTFGAGVQFQSYSFDKAMGAEAATLTLLPIAYSLPLGRRLGLDLYGAYADGRVEREGASYKLQGLVDTRIRATFQVAPWAVLTGSVNLPSGKATHDEVEAVVASVLSTDILGFREATWGTGFALTTGIAAALPAGAWNVGVGASYRLSQGFEPTEGTTLTYEPGDEIRVRAGLDRNVGADGKLTLGLTFQNFSEDQYESPSGGMRNLFQAGSRVRGDISYAFRSGRSTWAVYGLDVWRQAGDEFLDLVDVQGNVVGDTTLVVGSQNLLIVGVNGSTFLGNRRVRPAMDLRIQSREEGAGEGWLMGAGLDVPLRLSGRYDLFPRGKISVGQLKTAADASKVLWGMELGITFRWSVR